jgi:hypothetical protein
MSHARDFQRVTTLIEDAVRGVTGVETTTSTSRQGSMTVTLSGGPAAGRHGGDGRRTQDTSFIGDSGSDDGGDPPGPEAAGRRAEPGAGARAGSGRPVP